MNLVEVCVEGGNKILFYPFPVEMLKFINSNLTLFISLILLLIT